MNNTHPLVNVCMVTFNQETFIAQAIESVLMQTGDFKLKLIIRDDHSIDQTGNICKKYAEKYPDKILYSQTPRNLGPKLNFYQAMQQISGSYVALCEGDDYWTDPLKLQKQVRFLEENPSYNICFHKIEILLRNNHLVKDFITTPPKDTTTINDLVRKGNYIHTPSVVLRNTFKLEEWYTHCPIGDYPLYLLTAQNGKIKYLPETMAVYRFGGKFTKLSPVKKRVDFAITLGELIKNFPDYKIRELLIWKQKQEFLFFILIFPFFGKWNISDFKLALASQYRKDKTSQWE